MFFKQFMRDDLGCASYLVGDTDVHECVVVDPQWDIEDYVRTAEDNDMRIRYVIETHNHADHVSGHGKLAERGAEICIFSEAGVDYPHKALADGETIEIGKVRLKVLHTPGHRPEHIALEVIDTSRAEEPWLVLTGDALFVGAVGRPDLAIEPREGAAQLYESLRTRLLNLSDGVEIYPAHVSGSLCGKSMSPKGNSTIGFERRFNAPLKLKSSDAFVSEVTSDLPPQPPQFHAIVEKNRGPFITKEPTPKPMTAEAVDSARRDGAVLIDTRSPEQFSGGHIPGALNVDLNGGQFGMRAAWLIPAGKPVVLVPGSPDDLAPAVSSLTATGQDTIEGYLERGMEAWDQAGLPMQEVRRMPVEELHSKLEAENRSFVVLDVRERSEWREGHIPGSLNIPFHDIKEHIDELHTNKPVATVCGSGARSSIAASILQAEGFEPIQVTGGMEAWNEAGFGTEE